MHPFKRKFKTLISAKELTQIENWWQKLSLENQTSLRRLIEIEEEQDQQTVAIQLCGKFVEQEQIQKNDVFWVNHFYDYIISHELFVDESVPHIGGISSATTLAEQSIRKGFFPLNYKCPLRKKDCIMVKLLSQQRFEKGLALYLKFKIE